MFASNCRRGAYNIFDGKTLRGVLIGAGVLNGVNTVSVTYFALVKLYKVEFTKSLSAMIDKNFLSC